LLVIMQTPMADVIPFGWQQQSPGLPQLLVIRHDCELLLLLEEVVVVPLLIAPPVPPLLLDDELPPLDELLLDPPLDELPELQTPPPLHDPPLHGAPGSFGVYTQLPPLQMPDAL
jgi:hypothetical protein